MTQRRLCCIITTYILHVHYRGNTTTYKLIAATTLRAHFSDALKAVLGSRKLLLITKKNKPVSAILDIDFLEDLLAAASPEYVESIREAREDYKKGRVVGHQQVFGGL